ncbi:MAG: hypothetical protein IJA97_05625 [Clostridia bacterium]|nr:hypothetical protein [Clostridia bacterium]
MDKKILFVTMDCWSDLNGATTASTFASLFSNYNPENMASLYLREDVPSGKGCSKYFQISESAVIKSVLKPRVKTGKLYSSSDLTVSEEDAKNIDKTSERYKKYGKKRNRLLLFVREFIWRIGRWKSKALKEFLLDFKPDVIIYGMEGYRYFNRVVRYSLKVTKAKGVGFFWDDNFTFKQRKKDLLFLIERTAQRKSLKKTASKSSAFLAISPKTKAEADEYFKINSTVITKPIDVRPYNEYLVGGGKIKIVYAGNLKIGRLDTLKLLSDVLDKSEELKDRFEVDVYSQTYLSKEEKELFKSPVNLKGGIPSYEVDSVLSGADVLLLLEALKGKNKNVARLSFSTKLTDYLGSGKCIFAICVKEHAFSEYLAENDCALIAENEEDIKIALQKLANDQTLLNYYGKRAHDVAVKNHSREIIEEKLYSLLENL